MREISRKENISVNTIKKYLKKNNIEIDEKNIIYGLKSKNDLLIGLYCGIWAGDGTQYIDKGYRIKICCHSKDKELIKFIQKIILELFNKKTFVRYEERNRALIRFSSKYIYKFVYDYLDFSENKSLSVCLKSSNLNNTEYSKGFLLGLMITDGYLKNKFCYNTISEKLSQNLMNILKSYNLSPKYYTHKREKYGWNDLFMVSLKKEESKQINKILDNILQKLDYKEGFSKIKGYN